MTKKQNIERQQAIDSLRELIKPGDTVYTTLRHVSRSGMQRVIDLHIIKDNEPQWIGYTVATAIGWKFDDRRQGITVGGCGMDMGFHVVESLSYALYGGNHGYKCLGKNGKCPSNYHVNHHDRVRCEGTRVYNPDGPNTGHYCFRSSELRRQIDLGEGKTVDGGGLYVTEEDGKETICPKCNGEGYVDNPAGKEKWNLLHTDGYAIHQRWM